MLGVISERFPRGGALLLALVGASGSVSSALAGRVMGRIADTRGAAAVLPTWALLPSALCVVFVLIYLTHRARWLAHRADRGGGGAA